MSYTRLKPTCQQQSSELEGLQQDFSFKQLEHLPYKSKYRPSNRNCSEFIEDWFLVKHFLADYLDSVGINQDTVCQIQQEDQVFVCFLTYYYRHCQRENLALVGSCVPLGGWDITKAVRARELDRNVLPGWWYVVCQLPVMQNYHWRWVVVLKERWKMFGRRKHGRLLFEESCARQAVVIRKPHLHFSNWHRHCSHLMELENLPLLEATDQEYFHEAGCFHFIPGRRLHGKLSKNLSGFSYESRVPEKQSAKDKWAEAAETTPIVQIRAGEAGPDTLSNADEHSALVKLDSDGLETICLERLVQSARDHDEGSRKTGKWTKMKEKMRSTFRTKRYAENH